MISKRRTDRSYIGVELMWLSRIPLLCLLLLVSLFSIVSNVAASSSAPKEPKETARQVKAQATVSTPVSTPVSGAPLTDDGPPKQRVPTRSVPRIGEIDYVYADMPDSSAHLRHLAIRCQNIFPDSDPYSKVFYGRIANALHMTTRESVIRRGLGFREGDLVGRDDLEAAIRKLRTYYFLHSDVDMSVESVDDSIDLRIETRDIWTTRPLFEFSKAGDLTTWSAGIEEFNLFGGGKGLGFTVGHDEYQPYYGGWYRDPQLLNRDLLLRLAVISGKSLKMQRLDFVHPFDRAAVRRGLRWESRNYEGTFVDHRGGLDGPEWRLDKWILDAAGGPKIAGQGNEAWWLKPAVYLVSENYRPPKAGTEDALLASNWSPIERREIRAVGLELHFIHENYSQRAGINSFYRREDFNLGSDLRVRVGYSPETFGATQDGMFFKWRLVQGLSLGKHQMLIGSLWGESEYKSARTEDFRATSDIWYFRNLSHRQTLAMHLQSSWGWRVLPQKIFTLGAENSLRGFEAFAFSGERVMLANIEDRLVVLDNMAGLITLGIVGFIDGGVAWNIGAREKARPHINAGLGLRLLGSRTRGALVTRIDIGFPITDRDDNDSPVISIAAGQAF